MVIVVFKQYSNSNTFEHCFQLLMFLLKSLKIQLPLRPSVRINRLLVRNHSNPSSIRLHVIKDTIVIWNSKYQTKSLVDFVFSKVSA